MMRLKNFLVIGVILLVPMLVYWKLPLRGEVPFPGDLLVGRFFPWNSMAWPNYPLGVPYKEFIAADAVRQTYPWRRLAIEQLKQGQLPWWNPYAFGGTPLLANMQAAPFYPLNVIYWLVNFEIGWIIQVMLQPILAIGFTYLLGMSLKLSRAAALFSGVVFALCGYMVVWLELNTVGQAALWLPLILWSLRQALSRVKYYALTSFGLICSFFANHLQTTLYIVLVTLGYFLWLNFIKFRLPKKQVIGFLSALIITGLVVSIQLIPGYQLLQQSPRSGANAEIFKQFLMPWSHLITFIAPNYYGNPATNNYFGRDYGEFMAYFGIVALVFVLVSLFSKSKDRQQTFFIGVMTISLLLALPTPLAYLPQVLSIPILQSSAPARILFLTQFSAAILAGYGLDLSLKRSRTMSLSLGLVGASLGLLLMSRGMIWVTASDAVVKSQSYVSLRNLAVPSATWLSLASFFVISWLWQRQSQVNAVKLWGVGVFIIALGNYSFFANKYLPFAPSAFIFPETPIFSWLGQQAEYGRFFGDYTASVASNTWLPYELYGVEGYDSLYLERYGELVEASKNKGHAPESIPRSDANLEPNTDEFYRRRLQDLLGVRYILDKTEFPQSDWEHDIYRFPSPRYQLVWQQDQFKVYENTQALPRVMLVPTYEVIQDSNQMLQQIYNPDWQPTLSLLLEEKPSRNLISKIPPQTSAIDATTIEATGTAQIAEYSPNRVVVSTESNANQFLLLSDVYDSNWQAYLDGNLAPIHRANYAFRSILIPEGEHTVVFVYRWQW